MGPPAVCLADNDPLGNFRSGEVTATLEKVWSWVNWIGQGNGNQEIFDFYFKHGIMNVAKALMRRRLGDDKAQPLLVNAVRDHGRPVCAA